MQTFRIIGIKTKQFAAFESNFNRDQPELNIDNGFSYGIDLESSQFHCMISITLSQNTRPVIKIETEGVFQLDKESIDSFLQDNVFEMPEPIVRYFTDMVYGAMRGILVCKLEDTQLSDVILPPVNWNEVIDRPLSISLAQ